MEIRSRDLTYTLVQIDAPEIFADPAFQSWFSAAVATREVATWNRDPTIPPDEYSDIFMTMEVTWVFGELAWDGSNSDMPEHCMRAIAEKMAESGYTNGCFLVWLINIPD